MIRQLIFRPEAETDIDDVFAWYELRREGLGREFVLELNKVLGAIRRNPESNPRVHKKLRRALLERFPYAIFYDVRSDEIVVSAVFHQARDPSRWRMLG